MTKPGELNHQMLNYLLHMTRAEQDAMPPTRAGFIAWLGTEPGLEWLMDSPIREAIVAKHLLEHVSDMQFREHEPPHVYVEAERQSGPEAVARFAASFPKA